MSLATAAPPPPGAEFAIAATTSLQERRSRTLKHGDTFAVFDQNGDVGAVPGSPEGLYHRDTRYLSRFAMALQGTHPMLLSSSLRDDNGALICDLTNPDLRDASGLPLDHGRVHLRRTKFLWDASAFERLLIRNFSETARELTLEIRFDADFVDLFEVRGSPRDDRGQARAPEIGVGSVTLAYQGLDGQERRTRLRFDPLPARLDGGAAMFHLRLPPGGRELIYIEISCDGSAPTRRPRDRFLLAHLDARRAQRASSARVTAVETSNDILNEALCRSVSDITMLVTDTAEGPFPYAGIPWFSTVFGRDGIITALGMLWANPAMARGVLFYLAAHQAKAIDPVADAEPGKILHEVRHGEMAMLGEVPFRHYYGSVDSTPLFVMLAGAYLARTDDIEALRTLWPHVEAALGWIDRFGDRDGDGFVEYFRMTEKGLANQGWKDSHDSVFHADGSTAEGPLALCEVQAYVFGARRAAAAIARRLGHAERGAVLDAAADDLAQTFAAAFWCEDIGTYALALDGEKRPCRVRSSNAGHTLLTGIATPAHAERIAAQLLDSEFFSGWGIRTIAVGEPRFNPMSYHNGSVWPHDNALIAMGLARHGMRAEAARVMQGLFDACAYIDLRRLPELFCGFPRRRGTGPTFYPVACAPQAWAAMTPFSLMQSCLGLGFDPVQRRISFDRPTLPRFLDRVILRGLSIGDARMDVMLRGSGADVSMSVLARWGDIHATMIS